MSELQVCQGCGVALPEEQGPTHGYMLSSPACWAAFGAVLAREYGDMAGYGARHRMTVDAYACQHPGVETPASTKSVGIHLLRLCLLFERGLRIEDANQAMVRIATLKQGFRWMAPPGRLGEHTVVDVLAASSVAEHVRRVEAWTRSVWNAWAPHHAEVRHWADQL